MSLLHFLLSNDLKNSWIDTVIQKLYLYWTHLAQSYITKLNDYCTSLVISMSNAVVAINSFLWPKASRQTSPKYTLHLFQRYLYKFNFIVEHNKLYINSQSK